MTVSFTDHALAALLKIGIKSLYEDMRYREPGSDYPLPLPRNMTPPTPPRLGPERATRLTL